MSLWLVVKCQTATRSSIFKAIFLRKIDLYNGNLFLGHGLLDNHAIGLCLLCNTTRAFFYKLMYVSVHFFGKIREILFFNTPCWVWFFQEFFNKFKIFHILILNTTRPPSLIEGEHYHVPRIYLVAFCPRSFNPLVSKISMLFILDRGRKCD